MSQSHIILASQSTNRRKLLGLTGLDFTVLPSEFDEYAVRPQDFSHRDEYIAAIATGKLLAVADTLAPAEMDSTYLIGGDLVVYCLDRLMHKPKDLTEAQEFIELLAGNTHEEVCATAFWSAANGISVQIETVRVSVPEMSAGEIKNYLESCNPLEKAGGFSIVTVQKILRQRRPAENAVITGSLSGLLGISLPSVERFLDSTHISLPVSAKQIEAQLAHELIASTSTTEFSI